MRWLAHLRARLGGYFWHPCPVCGQMFGGHERSTGEFVAQFNVLGEKVQTKQQITCPHCPGAWVEMNGRVGELRVEWMAGEPVLMLVTASSAWKRQPLRRF